MIQTGWLLLFAVQGWVFIFIAIFYIIKSMKTDLLLIEQMQPQSIIWMDHSSTHCQLQQSYMNSQQTLNFKDKQIMNNHSGLSISNMADDTSSCLEKENNKKISENKLKYKKLKQKLNSLCQQMLDQGWLKDQKDLTSPNKSRLMKLAMELQKSMKTQAKDYVLLQSLLKQIQKIIEYKREHDILILRGVRLMNTLIGILKQFPSLHRNEALQSMPVIQLSLRILKIMLSISSSRYLLLSSNQMMVISTLLSCALMREEKKIAISCLSLLNLIIIGPNKVEFRSILNANIQYILVSSVLKRLKTYLQICIIDEDNSNAQFLLVGLTFFYLVTEISCLNQLQAPIYAISKDPNTLIPTVKTYFQIYIPLLLHIINELTYQKQDQGQQKYKYREEQIPNFKINVLLYIFKILNIMFHIDVCASQKIIEKERQFYVNVHFIFQYCKEHFKESTEIKNLCSQIIIFIGNCTFENFQIQEIVRHQGIVQSLCEHPIDYLMDHSLKVILISSFCSLIFNNLANFKAAFAEYSVQPILQFLEKEIKNYRMNKKNDEQYYNNNERLSQVVALSRKASVSSLNSTYSKASMAESYQTQASYNIGFVVREYRLQRKFSPSDWESMVRELHKFDE